VKHISKLFVIPLVFVCLASTVACADSTWEGAATNEKGTFNFGPVSFVVKGNEIVNFKIERVTTSGCGGMKSVIVPSGIKIQGSEFGGSYQPIDGVDDTIIVTGTLTGNSASGSFSEGPTCRNSGKFTATAK